MPPIDPYSIGAILIALIAALGTWASHKSSAKASTINAKAAAEVEAYNRARKMDLETIQRQDAEIDDIRAENGILKKRVREVELDNDELREDNTKLRRRVTALERKLENPDEE